jgi:AP-2 complex subunit alpha
MELRYTFPNPYFERKYSLSPQMIRLTIRATDESVPPVLIKIMEERLQIGISTAPEIHEGPTRREISDAFGNVLVE